MRRAAWTWGVGVLLAGLLLPGCRDTVRLAGVCEARTCEQAGAGCGSVSDGCGGLLQCGGCPDGETCGGGGTPNQCGGAVSEICTPHSCEQLGATCGSAADGCGGTLACGSCPDGLSCGADGRANTCASPPARAPGAPREVQATAGDATAEVRWQPPADDGGSPLLRYTVTVEPGGAQQVVPATGTLQATFRGLTNGTAYTFRVRATSAAGTGPAAASNPVVPRGPCLRTLAPAQSYPTGINPAELTVADLSGDGHPDLVVGLHGGSAVTVLRNRGDGRFLPAATTPVLSGTYPVVADFNRDGRLDVATSLRLAVLYNEGGGRLAGAVDFGSIGFHMAAGDLDGDGWVDLVSGGLGGEGVSLRRNLRNGTFEYRAEPPSDDRLASVQVMDLDGDGHLDVAYANVRDPTVRVLLGRGDGTFAPEGAYPTGHAFLGEAEALYRLLAVDLSGDGRPELLAGDEHRLVLLQNAGDGTFTDAGRLTLPQDGWSSWGVAAGDFDGDGRNDLAITHGVEDQVTLHLNRGAPLFVPGGTFAVGRQPLYATAGDLNGDGFADLVVSNSMGDSVSVLLNVCAPEAELRGREPPQGPL